MRKQYESCDNAFPCQVDGMTLAQYCLVDCLFGVWGCPAAIIIIIITTTPSSHANNITPSEREVFWVTIKSIKPCSKDDDRCSNTLTIGGGGLVLLLSKHEQWQDKHLERARQHAGGRVKLEPHLAVVL